MLSHLSTLRCYSVRLVLFVSTALLLVLVATRASAQLQPAARPAVNPGQNGDRAVYTHAEYLPLYPGGQKQLVQDINANLKYPKAAKAANLGGSILVGLTIGSNGLLRDVKLVEHLTAGTGQERMAQELQDAALQAVRDVSAHWRPALQNNKPVAFYSVLTLQLHP